MDKPHDKFLEEINNIMQPFRVKSTDASNYKEVDFKPITSYRNFINPTFDIKKLIVNHANGYPERVDFPQYDIEFNLWELYSKSFKELYKKYFMHLNDDNHDIPEIKAKKYEQRNNVYQNFKLKICLIEDYEIMSQFLKQVWHFYEKLKELNEVGNLKREEHQDEVKFWKMFNQDLRDFVPKFIIYLIPYNIQEGKNVNPHLYYTSMLSEYLSEKDHIYETLIFNTWMMHRESYDISKLKSIKCFNVLGTIQNLEKRYGLEQM